MLFCSCTLPKIALFLIWMKSLKSLIVVLIGAFVILLASGLFIQHYSWLFAKRIRGQVIEIESSAVPSTQTTNGSSETAPTTVFTVLIEASDGKMYTSTTTDEQWKVVRKGYCAQVLLYRYPPWDLERAGTFFNARLRQLYRCDEAGGPPKMEAAPDAH